MEQSKAHPGRTGALHTSQETRPSTALHTLRQGTGDGLALDSTLTKKCNRHNTAGSWDVQGPRPRG